MNIICTLLINPLIYKTYPQYMCISSEKLLKTLSVDTKKIQNETVLLSKKIEYPKLVGGRNKSKIEWINRQIYSYISAKEEEADEYVNQIFYVSGSKPYKPYEIKSTYKVESNNDNILSFYIDYYEYLGGAHGSTMRTSYTIDKNKEELISISDLFIKGYDFKSEINKIIREQISNEPEKYFYTAESFKGINDNQKFYIKDRRLIIYFDLYEIAPYAAGIPEFEIDISNFGDNYIYAK